MGSDDDLENDEWKDEAAGVKLRHKVQKAILGEAMDQQGAANGEMIEHRSISETLMDIFDDIDKDGGGSLELDELKEGLRRHGGLEDLKDEETPGNAKQEKRLAKKAKRDDKKASKVSASPSKPKNEKNRSGDFENPLARASMLQGADAEVAPSDDENPSFAQEPEQL